MPSVEEEIDAVLHLEPEYRQLFLAGRLGNAPQFDKLIKNYRREHKWSERFLQPVFILGMIPVGLVFLILGFTYITVIVDFLVPELWPEWKYLFLFLVVVYHILIILMLWSYLRTVFSSPGYVPLNFIVTNHIANATPAPPARRRSQPNLGTPEEEKRVGGVGEDEVVTIIDDTGQEIVLSEISRVESSDGIAEVAEEGEFQAAPGNSHVVELGEMGRDAAEIKLVGDGALGRDAMPVQTRKGGGSRVCGKCNKPKPDRSHHCRICKKCILKMDHHCPWVNNCVGWNNYKFFILFVMWTCVLAIFTAMLVFPHILGTGFVSDVALSLSLSLSLLLLWCIPSFSFSHAIPATSLVSSPPWFISHSLCFFYLISFSPFLQLT